MSAIDIYRQYSGAPIGPARRLRPIVPHDTEELEYVANGLVCAGDGLLSLVAVDDTVPVTVPVATGQIYLIRARMVRATGTTATGIVALIS